MSNRTIVYKQLRKTTKGLFFLIILSLILAIFLVALVSVGLNTHRELVIWGFVSIAPVLLILIIMSIISGIMNTFVVKSRYSDLWKAQRNRDVSTIERLGAQIKIQNIDDLELRSSSKKSLFWAACCLLLWLMVFLFVAIGALIFKVRFLIDFLNNFK
jgi:hypothetical protein